MSAWTCRQLTARPTKRLFRLVLEPHDGRALAPIPKRSTSPWADIDLVAMEGLKALDPNRRLEKRTCRRLCRLASKLIFHPKPIT